MATIFNSLWEALRWTWHDPDGYNIISGPLADLALLGGAYAILRRHNCHAKGCWRLARHPVPGTSYIVCRKHHPHDKPTAEQILVEHRAFVEATGAAGTAAEQTAPGGTAPGGTAPGGTAPGGTAQ